MHRKRAFDLAVEVGDMSIQFDLLGYIRLLIPV